MLAALVVRAEAAGAGVVLAGGAPGQKPRAAAEAENKPKKVEAEPAAKGSVAWKEAEKLVAEWLADPKTSLSELAKIQKIIVGMGANDYQVREDASAEILKFGQKALPELEKARKNKDPEVVSRAETAISKIKSGDRKGEIVFNLREMKATTLAVIDELIKAEQDRTAVTKKEASRLLADGKKDESLAKLKNAKASIHKALTMAGLRNQVAADDPLAEIKKLVKQGKHAAALKKLQDHSVRLKQGGKLDPARQKEYKRLLMQIFQGMKGGVRGQIMVN